MARLGALLLLALLLLPPAYAAAGTSVFLAEPGVDFTCLQEIMAAGHAVVESEYSREGTLPIVTSACRPGSRFDGSLHDEGYALDYRIWNLPKQKRPLVADAIQRALGKAWDVVLEPNHLHIEWDPLR